MVEWVPTALVFANIQPLIGSMGRLYVPIICEYIQMYKFIDQEVELEQEPDEFYETDHEHEYGNELIEELAESPNV